MTTRHLGLAADRRDKLLDAAEDVIGQKGVAAATIEDIASRAGVAKGSLYLHFSSKDRLLAALRDRFAARIVNEQRAAVGRLAGAHWQARLDAWVESGVRAVLDNLALHRALVHADGPAKASPGSCRDWGAGPYRTELADLLRSGVEAGELDSSTHVPVAAMLLCGALHSSVEHLLHRRTPRLSERELVREAKRFCRAYLRGPVWST